MHNGAETCPEEMKPPNGINVDEDRERSGRAPYALFTHNHGLNSHNLRVAMKAYQRNVDVVSATFDHTCSTILQLFRAHVQPLTWSRRRPQAPVDSRR